MPPSGYAIGLRRLLVVALLVAAANARAAAVPVEEAWPAERETERPQLQAAPTAPAQEASEAGLASLYYQLQLLQDDLKRLQGIVEEQGYRIQRLTEEQRQRYIELDQRLLDLGRSPIEGNPSLGGRPVGAQPLGSEREAYNAAFAIVKDAPNMIRSERLAAYQDALVRFEAHIENFPNGEFVANAFYWIGEIRLYMDELELARQAFAQLVNLFSDHAKVPDALYKLGVVYHRLGDNESALRYLDRVASEHSDHTAAGLARSYAAELR